MRKYLLLFIALFLIPISLKAQEYTANTWASWASVTSQVDWFFPYQSRQVVVINGSSVPICVSFGRSAVISNSCTDTANDVFQVPATQNFVIRDIARPEVHIRSASTAASPVSVLVTY